MAFLEQMALAVTRAIDPKRLYDWMIAISRAAGNSPAFLGIGPFATVARASSSRMLDLTEGQCASLSDGDQVWVDSCGGGPWFWRASVPAGFICDNITTCRPTEWAAAAGPPDGAFVRGTEGIRLAQQQTAWQVDSTATDNEGAGTLADPVQSDVEIARRYGPGTTELFDTVTITYAQAPTATETLLDVSLPQNKLFKIKGTPADVLTGQVLSAVQVQVRTAGSEARWAITAAGFAGGHVGHLAIIRQSATPSHVGAYARVMKSEGGGKLIVSPFGTYVPDFLPLSQITPSIGDVVDIITPMNLPIANLAVSSATTHIYGAFPPTFTNYLQVEDCRLDGGDDGGGQIHLSQTQGFGVRSFLRNVALVGAGDSSTVAQMYLAGGGVDGTLWVAGNIQLSQSGVLEAAIFTQPSGGSLVLDTDTYFQNSTLFASFAETHTISFGASFFDQDVSDNTIVVGPSAMVVQGFGVPDWGTNNSGHGIKIQSNGTYTYATKPTVNGTLGAGREALIGGTDKQYAAVPYTEAANTAKLVITA